MKNKKQKPAPKFSNKKLAQAVQDRLAKQGISKDWMKNHLIVMGGN